MSEWGDRIALRLSVLGMSQAELARTSGVSQPSVNDWLSGKTKMIDGANLLAVSKTLSVAPEWIIHGRNSSSQSARYSASILTDAMALLDQIDKIWGRPVEARPNPVRLAIACEVIEAGGVDDKGDVVVRLADRLRAAEAGNGDGSGKVEGTRTTDGGSHGAKARTSTAGRRK